MIPTIVYLVDQIALKPLEIQPPQALQLEEEHTTEETVLPIEDEPTIEPIPEPQPPFEPFLPSTPVNQFMVEKIGGILLPG